MPRTKHFSPGVIDYDGMSTTYQSGRTLSPEAASTWSAIVAPFVQRSGSSRILDLGAGTGRFATLFARSFEAHVMAIEPSKGMLAAACSEDGPRNLAYVAGSAERIPLRRESCHLAWLSQVWHHIWDREACAREIRRILHRDGHVLVRGTFGDQLDGFPTLFRYWPASREICRQLPSIQQTARVFEAAGFVLSEHRRVQQITCGSLREFARRTQLRADTALTLISDSDFREGQAAIEQSAAGEGTLTPVAEVIELLVFRCEAA
jgi:ubiquinone/menaquinone biosynthesis C-methylase UbiE